MAAAPTTTPDRRGNRRRLVPLLLRYAGGSAVATVSSEVTFVLFYGPLDVSPAWASVVAWLAGAVPNYWLNRSWTWRRTGRPSLRGEILPYVAIIGLTLLLATLATKAADAWLSGTDVSGTLRVTLVAAVFLGVYVVMFLLRFVLLDRLFTRLSDGERAAEEQTVAQTGAQTVTESTEEARP